MEMKISFLQSGNKDVLLLLQIQMEYSAIHNPERVL